ncbi:MAG: hypothetical protein Tsb0020_05880 [Haliangiales bacterium]
MTLKVLPFRPDAPIPSVEQFAELLLAAIPEQDRKTARKLLVGRILPVKLAGVDQHPARASRVHRELARVLSGQPANMRLHALQVSALDADISAIARDALNLGISRYLGDYPEAAHRVEAEPWLQKSELDELRGCSNELLARRAEVQIRALRDWQERVRSGYPAEWERQRERYIQVLGWLTAVEKGDFSAVTGSLANFLRDVNARERR